MRFVYTCTSGFRWALVLEDVALLLWRVPKACIVDGRDVEILSNSLDPRWNTLLACVVVWNNKRNLPESVSILTSS